MFLLYKWLVILQGQVRLSAPWQVSCHFLYMTDSRIKIKNICRSFFKQYLQFSSMGTIIDRKELLILEQPLYLPEAIRVKYEPSSSLIHFISDVQTSKKNLKKKRKNRSRLFFFFPVDFCTSE